MGAVPAEDKEDGDKGVEREQEADESKDVGW